jgi:hypothetical protein
MLGIFFDADGTLWSHPKSKLNYVDKSLFELFDHLNLNKISYFVVSGTTKEIIDEKLKEFNIYCIDKNKIIALADGGINKGNKMQELILTEGFNKVIWVFDKIKDYNYAKTIENVRHVIIQREHNNEDILEASKIKEIEVVSSLGEVLKIIKEV